MTYLLDVNVLIALAWPTHIHHTKAHTWFASLGTAKWATCPLTQLAFIRISSNPKAISSAVSTPAAMQMLGHITKVRGHVFWADELALEDLTCFQSPLLVGHRQTTDAYLLELARSHKAKLATFDGGLSELLQPSEMKSLIALLG